MGLAIPMGTVTGIVHVLVRTGTRRDTSIIPAKRRPLTPLLPIVASPRVIYLVGIVAAINTQELCKCKILKYCNIEYRGTQCTGMAMNYTQIA